MASLYSNPFKCHPKNYKYLNIRIAILDLKKKIIFHTKI